VIALKLKIEFLYFDKSSCDRCKATDRSIAGALKELKGVLKESGADFELVERRLDESQLERSPTILINGRDIEAVVGGTAASKSACSACAACSGLVGRPASCRSFSYRGKKHDAIPRAMIEEAVRLSLGRRNSR